MNDLDNKKTNYGVYANGLLVETCSINYLENRSNMTILGPRTAAQCDVSSCHGGIKNVIKAVSY